VSSAQVVAVTGSSGRLGTAIVQRLAQDGVPVRALDVVEGISPPGVDFWPVDVQDERSLAVALDGVDVLVHVAGLHGAHLVAGMPRQAFWKVNVDGTWRVLRQAVRCRTRRVVFASSTSVYGPGSKSGEARVLDESTSFAPDDVYDITKILGERMLLHLRERYDVETVALRLGRFFYGNRSDYHLRKLSTGLDLYDAATAFSACVHASSFPRAAYCVASDSGLSTTQRKRLGTDLPGVVAEVLPELPAKLAFFGYPTPARFGKSSSTAALRADLGWAPVRDLLWWCQHLDDQIQAERTEETRRGAAA